jgi:uncharacterized protein
MRSLRGNEKESMYDREQKLCTKLEELQMMDVFTRFKSRYIVLDYIWISIVIGILLGIISTVTGLPLKLDNSFWLLGVYSLIMIFLCLVTFSRLQNHRFQLKYLIGNQSIQKLPSLLLLIVFYGFQSLMAGVSQITLFSAHLVAPEWTESAIRSAESQFTLETNSLLLKVLLLGVLFFSIVIVAPVTEEFIFRGVLLHRFNEKWDTTTAILVCSILFGIVHFNIYSVAIAISFIFIALIYLQTRSLLVPIALHAMNNAVVWMNLLIHAFFQAEPQVNVTVQTLWAGLFNTVMALPILFYFLKWPDRFDLLPYAANSRSQETEDNQESEYPRNNTLP